MRLSRPTAVVVASSLALVATLAVASIAVPPAPEPVVPPSAPAAWSPPVWLSPEAALLVDDLTAAPLAARGPSLRARSAIVADLDQGTILWARDPDTPRPVASLTKLVSALTLRAVAPDADLDRTLCVTHELWPPKPGAFSKFETGRCHEGWDYVGAALVSSDNRGAMAMASLAGLPFEAFVDAMNETTGELGLDATWEDPTGLGENNRASARDMLKIAVAAAHDPLVSHLASAPAWRITRSFGPQALFTTNALAEATEPVAAKTGYTDAAMYCYAAVLVTPSGRRLGVAVLGAPSSASRFDDVRRLVAYAEGLDAQDG